MKTGEKQRLHKEREHLSWHELGRKRGVQLLAAK
jgi:hypothetical protein